MGITIKSYQNKYCQPQYSLTEILHNVRQCRFCEKKLAHEPRPTLRANEQSKLLIVGQAPGTQVHKTGIPWNDLSGDRLRQWLNISKDVFYDEHKIAIIPMGFCYPGKGKSGDLPPRRECAQIWLPHLLTRLPNIQLILLIGQYAQHHYLGQKCKKTLTVTVKSFKDYVPKYFPLPHPSPRNTYWLQQNKWFETEVIPSLQKLVKNTIK